MWFVWFIFSVFLVVQSQRAEGEALPSDSLPPHHTRQTRSAPAFPSGQLASYTQPQEGADARSSLSQLLARLISRKGEDGKGECNWSESLLPSHLITYRSFLFPSWSCYFLSSFTSIPLRAAVTHAARWSHHLAFPRLPPALSSISLYLLLAPSLCPSISTPDLTLSVTVYLWLSISRRCVTGSSQLSGTENKCISMTYFPQPHSKWFLHDRYVHCCHVTTSSCHHHPHPVSSRLSLPDQILPDQQSQRPGPQPQDKGQRLPWLDGLWTTQRRGVRVLLLKARLAFSPWNKKPEWQPPTAELIKKHNGPFSHCIHYNQGLTWPEPWTSLASLLYLSREEKDPAITVQAATTTRLTMFYLVVILYKILWKHQNQQCASPSLNTFSLLDLWPLWPTCVCCMHQSSKNKSHMCSSIFTNTQWQLCLKQERSWDYFQLWINTDLVLKSVFFWQAGWRVREWVKICVHRQVTSKM